LLTSELAAADISDGSTKVPTEMAALLDEWIRIISRMLPPGI